MSFRDYLSSKAIVLCMIAIGFLYFILIIWLCGMPLYLLLILFGGIFITFSSMVLSWRCTDRKLRNLRSRLDSISDKYLIGEILPRPRDAVELEYYMIMKEISRSAIGKVEKIKAEKQEYCDFVEGWVHEIKTPLTACSLIVSNGDNTVKLQRELCRADNLTETILTYVKLQTPEKDIRIAPSVLRDICNRAVREEMVILIAAGISVDISGEGTVYTDPKMLGFIIKQLLVNCAKYCPGCHVNIELSENGLLFEDNGPGIPDHEIQRVTERGFTGIAGRSRGYSTGMGLYIVSRLCGTLNIEMSIDSLEGSFTRFLFRFPAKTLQNC